MRKRETEFLSCVLVGPRDSRQKEEEGLQRVKEAEQSKKEQDSWIPAYKTPCELGRKFLCFVGRYR